MITYIRLIQHPEVCLPLIGMNLSDFDELFEKFQKIDAMQRFTAQTCSKKQRPGYRQPVGGRPHKYDLRDRLLITLFWLQVRPTQSVLASVVGLTRCNVVKFLKDVQRTLTSPEINYAIPIGNRRLLRSVQAVVAAFPEI